MKQLKKIILASASPRRRELLANIGIEYDCETPAVLEMPFEEGKISQVVGYNALIKAKSLQKAGYAVIGADTAVSLNDKGFGKPKSEEEAFEFLSALSGKTHKVYTGVAVVCDGFEKVEVVETQVKFRHLCNDEIMSYIKSGSPMDKAGAYGIQDFGGVFVKEIKGDYFNIVGLPIATVYSMLLEGKVIDLSE